MTAETAPDGAWLFVRGSASVRISRRQQSGGYLLVVHGPGTELSMHECHDIIECVDEQMRVERRLMAQGFMLDVFTSDRRAAHPSLNPGPERRRDRRAVE